MTVTAKARLRSWSILSAALVVISALASPAAEAASQVLPLVFVVDAAVDVVDAVPGDGACATAAGLCTLRAAVQEANASPGAHTIVL